MNETNDMIFRTPEGPQPSAEFLILGAETDSVFGKLIFIQRRKGLQWKTQET